MNTLIVALLLTVGGDLTNSHKVAPLVATVAAAPEIEMLYTWEVGFVGGKTVVIKATKMLENSGLILFADENEEIALAVNKTQFVYARKIKDAEKKP